MRSIRPVVLLLALACGLFLPTAPARAESRETDSITLGWMTEHADLVVVLAPADDGAASASRRVESVVRGTAQPSVRILVRDDVVVPVERTLAFLVRSGDDWVPVSGGHALKAVDDDAAPFLVHTRTYAGFLADDGRVARGEALRAFLVGELSRTESGLPFSAGRDLVRHRELLSGVTPDERRAITAALSVERKADQDLASLVRVAGVAGDATTTPRLVSLLLAPATHTLRSHLAWALTQRVASPGERVVDALTASLGIDTATPTQREDVAVALGALEVEDAATPLASLLRDPEPQIRAVAAHGLGLLARAVRRPPAAGVAEPEGGRPRLTVALEPLRRVVADATTPNEQRAAVWAIAQIDTAEAWTQLADWERDHPADDVRALAARYRKTPRVALVLDR